MENTNYEADPVIVVKIKDVAGGLHKFVVKERPTWDDDLVYINRNERGLIAFNPKNIISYSEKVIIPKKRPKIENRVDETEDKPLIDMIKRTEDEED